MSDSGSEPDLPQDVLDTVARICAGAYAPSPFYSPAPSPTPSPPTSPGVTHAGASASQAAPAQPAVPTPAASNGARRSGTIIFRGAASAQATGDPAGLVPCASTLGTTLVETLYRMAASQEAAAQPAAPASAVETPAAAPGARRSAIIQDGTAIVQADAAPAGPTAHAPASSATLGDQPQLATSNGLAPVSRDADNGLPPAGGFERLGRQPLTAEELAHHDRLRRGVVQRVTAEVDNLRLVDGHDDALDDPDEALLHDDGADEELLSAQGSSNVVSEVPPADARLLLDHLRGFHRWCLACASENPTAREAEHISASLRWLAEEPPQSESE